MSEQRQQRGWGNDAGRRGSREGRREGLELAAHQVRVRILLRGTTRSIPWDLADCEHSQGGPRGLSGFDPNLEGPGGVWSQQIPHLILSNFQNLSKPPEKSWSPQTIIQMRSALFTCNG